MKKIVALLTILLSFSVLAGIDVKTYIPKQAPQYLPTLKLEQEKYWKDHPAPYVMGGLIEQES